MTKDSNHPEATRKYQLPSTMKQQQGTLYQRFSLISKDHFQIFAPLILALPTKNPQIIPPVVQLVAIRLGQRVPCPPPPPPCISYAKIPNQYGPYAYCSLDTGVACAQHIQLPTPGTQVQKERIAW